MSSSLIKDNKGQVQVFIVAAVLFVVLIAVVAFGMSLVANFQGNTAATGNAVPFNGIWPQVVMGFALIGLLITVVVMVKNSLG